MKTIIAATIFAVTILLVNAKETLLNCDTCQNCPNPQPRNSIKIDFDNSTVTMTFSPQNITSYRAKISNDFVV